MWTEQQIRVAMKENGWEWWIDPDDVEELFARLRNRGGH